MSNIIVYFAFFYVRRTLKQSIENSNVKSRLAEVQKTNESLKRMLSHMPTVEVKHQLVVQQVSFVVSYGCKLLLTILNL